MTVKEHRQQFSANSATTVKHPAIGRGKGPGIGRGKSPAIGWKRSRDVLQQCTWGNDDKEAVGVQDRVQLCLQLRHLTTFLQKPTPSDARRPEATRLLDIMNSKLTENREREGIVTAAQKEVEDAHVDLEHAAFLNDELQEALNKIGLDMIKNVNALATMNKFLVEHQKVLVESARRVMAICRARESQHPEEGAQLKRPRTA